MKFTKEQYDKFLKDYDRVGAELDDAKENGTGQSKIIALKRELASLEKKIHSFERDYDYEMFDVTGIKDGERVVISKNPVDREEAEEIVADAIKSKLYGDVKLSPALTESYKLKIHRNSYPKGYKKLKHIKLFEAATSGVRTNDSLKDTIWSLFNYTDLYQIDVRHVDIVDAKIDYEMEKKLKPLIAEFKKTDEKQAKLLEKIFSIVLKNKE